MTAPVGQSCANCTFYINSSCHRQAPIYVLGSSQNSRWASVESTEWCAYWNLWPPGPASSVLGGAISSGQTAPSGGTDGDYYVKYTVVGDGITALAIYQKQTGSWVVIQTIL